MDPLTLTNDDLSELQEQVFYKSPFLSVNQNYGYENWCQTVKYEHTLHMDVYNTETICEILKRLNKLNDERAKTNKNKLILRAAAGRIEKSQEHINAFSNILSDTKYQNSFSVSPCVEAHVILHLAGEEFYKIDPNGELVTVGANVQIGQLEATLYQPKYNLSLPVSPLIPWVTLVGLAANAGHGTGLNQPAITGLIESITMIKANGEEKTITKDDPDFDVINGAHLGLFGVVTKVTIRCIPACKLKATKYAWSLNEFTKQVEENNLYENNEYVSVMYVPTYYELNDEKDQTNVNVVVANRVPIETPDSNWSELIQGLDNAKQVSEMDLFNRWRVSYVLRHIPSVIPLMMKVIVSKKVGVKGATPVEVTGPFYQLAHYQRQFPRELDDIDFLFPVKEPKQMLTALNKIVTTLEKYRAQGYYPVNDAIYIRMFKGTNGGLSTSSNQQDEYIAAIDVVADPETPHYQLPPEEIGKGLSNQFKEEIQEYFMNPNNSLHAKPHWGKSLPLNTNYAMLYGDNFEQFMRVAENWYKDVGCTFATSPFMNPFYERIFNIAVSESKLELRENISEKPTFLAATVKTKIVNDYELKLLQKYMDALEKDLLMEPNIRQPESSFNNMPTAVENSQVDQNKNDLPPICLFSGAGDADSFRKQQQQIRSTATDFVQEVRKAVAAAAKIASN